MAGISTYGVHIPRLRLPLSLINSPGAAPSAAEKAVAGLDEDVITMAVSAATQCLTNLNREAVDHLYLASTSLTFAEKSSAAIVAQALNLRGDVLSVDYGASLRAGAAALRAAVSAVEAGAARSVLVVASDARTAEPYSTQELHFGDAAVAFLVDRNGPFQLEGDRAINRPIFDVWREDTAPTVRTWEDRFVVQHGLEEAFAEILPEFLARHELLPEAIQAVACYAPDPRSHAGIARQLGFEKTQLVDPLFGKVGNCGAAFVPLLMVQAMQTATSGDRLLALFYGDGAHVMSWKLTEARIDPSNNTTSTLGSVANQLGNRIVMDSYRSYLLCRGLDTGRAPTNKNEGISATVQFREQDAEIALRGVRCRRCETEQFPPVRVCYRCFAKDEFDRIALATRRGTVASYTKDYFFPSPIPPVVAGMCEADGGARLYLQMADYAGEPLATGLPVEFVFRKIHQAGGKPAYFWKSRLLPASEGPHGD